MKEYHKLSEFGDLCLGQEGKICKWDRKECVVSSHLYVFKKQEIIKKMNQQDEDYANFYKNLEKNYKDFSKECYSGNINHGNRITQERANTQALSKLFQDKFRDKIEKNMISIKNEVTVKTKYGNKRPDFLISDDENIDDINKNGFDGKRRYYFIEFKGSGDIKAIGDALIQSMIIREKILETIDETEPEIDKIYGYSLIVFFSGANNDLVEKRKKLIENKEIKKYIHSHHVLHPAHGTRFVKKQLDSLFSNINTFFKIN